MSLVKGGHISMRKSHTNGISSSWQTDAIQLENKRISAFFYFSIGVIFSNKILSLHSISKFD